MISKVFFLIIIIAFVHPTFTKPNQSNVNILTTNTYGQFNLVFLPYGTSDSTIMAGYFDNQYLKFDQFKYTICKCRDIPEHPKLPKYKSKYSPYKKCYDISAYIVNSNLNVPEGSNGVFCILYNISIDDIKGANFTITSITTKTSTSAPIVPLVAM